MKLSLVVAVAKNNAIGKNNQLLWRLPNDMRFFKNRTWGLPVIMGRKTYESLGKPLAGRLNIVITHQQNWRPDNEDVVVVNSLDAAIESAALSDAKEASIIGGGEIYKQSIERAERIFLTRVYATPEADTYFPEIDEKNWRLASCQDFPSDDKHAYSYSFQEWVRLP